MRDSIEVTYAILVKHSMSFYTQIRYALPGLFHMWKPTFWADLGRVSPKDSTPGPAAYLPPWLIPIRPRGMGRGSAAERGESEAFRLGRAVLTIVEGETVMRA